MNYYIARWIDGDDICDMINYAGEVEISNWIDDDYYLYIRENTTVTAGDCYCNDVSKNGYIQLMDIDNIKWFSSFDNDWHPTPFKTREEAQEKLTELERDPNKKGLYFVMEVFK